MALAIFITATIVCAIAGIGALIAWNDRKRFEQWCNDNVGKHKFFISSNR